jgi:hypothetical protein
MDTGVVGIVDLTTKKSSRMKVNHTNVSPHVIFISLISNKLRRLAGLLNLFLIGLAKYLAADTTAPSFTLISYKAAYFRD